ncbi:MAG: 23S rRNA (guanosine(2251)-2'-O)-methyltransferase RlmB [Deferribacteraceae bacterium]|jgi:23S rRNA (guanosine2251-2'-O)-methyltransferase|nr:23S rRNA (guanosine(2251)-2'-O)-methyltransferase RlmB [Deferribacteraceae bacterium]
MIVYGKNPVFEAVKAAKAHKIYIRKGAALYGANFNLPVQMMNKGEFDSRFHREAQGIAAEVDEITPVCLDDVTEEILKVKGVVILDRIQDPNNYGAIIRSAHCFGIKHIIAPRYHQANISPAVCKASAGAIFYTTVIEETNLSAVCARLKGMGYTVTACDTQAEKTLKEAKFSGKTAVIIGSEGRGVRSGLLQNADQIVRIPIQGRIDSLNAAGSAAIALYEIFGESFNE